jgi:transposase
MLANELDYVLGVDTHRDEHVMAVVTAPAGAVVAGAAAPANARGYRELLRVAERYAPGRRAWAIEGTGSYGAGLARHLCGRGETVLEVSRAPRSERRLHGKDDALNAATSARAALANEKLALPRSGERREALRLLIVARRGAVDARRGALTQLRAVIVTAPEPLRQQLRRLPEGKLLARCSRFRRTGSAGADELEREILGPRPRTRADAARRARRRADRRCPAPRRLVTPRQAALGSVLRPLAGVAPIPASSGQTTRHRLSRGGDRQLNRALHTIALHRRQHDPATRDYIARRVAEGKSAREATRLLKRYLARHLYRLLQNQEPLLA